MDPLSVAGRPEPGLLTIVDDDLGAQEFETLTSGPPDGPPVLLLHGWPQGAASFAAVLPALGAAGLRAVALEQRGYSPGARPTEVAAYALDRLVADASGALDALGWATAHVVGHDWGAAVAWALAARQPDRVESLTGVSIPHPACVIAAAEADEQQRARLGYMDVLRAPGGVAERVLLADDAAALRAVYAGAVPEEQVRRYVERLTEPGAMSAVLAWYRAMDQQAWAAVPPVPRPTTYVWGEEDIAIGPGAARSCGQWVTGPYAFLPLAGRGHWLPEEAPAEVAAAAIARITGRPPS